MTVAESIELDAMMQESLSADLGADEVITVSPACIGKTFGVLFNCGKVAACIVAACLKGCLGVALCLGNGLLPARCALAVTELIDACS